MQASRRERDESQRVDGGQPSLRNVLGAFLQTLNPNFDGLLC